MFLDDEDASQDEVVRGFPLGKDSNGDVRYEDADGDADVRQGRRRLRRAAEHHAHIVFKRAGSDADHVHADLSDYAFMEPDSIPARGSRARRSIVKREAPYVIYPEILVIVDYDGYRLHGGDNVQIKRYFVSFWNGVDLRYKLLKGPRIRISIAGIIISRGRDATPYLERNRVGRDAIDSAAALTDMGKYLFRERRLPVYDIAVAVTKYDMCRRRKGGRCTKGTAGFAYVGGACVVNKRLEKVNSVAIIEDTGGFSGIIVAAHEVGHLLGAVHDGSPPPSYLGGPGAEKCRWEDGYIMSDLRHTEKGFKWSPCTVASFHHFLNGDTATCLYNSPHEDESLPRVLPGKLLTLDAQCRKDRGTSACFKDDRVCAQLFCFDSGSGYCVAYRPAAEGSPCGDGQYCMNGKCVVEHENIIPDYSQNAPAFLRRIDDDGSSQPRPYYTYNITTQRSDWAEFWNDRLNDITTTSSPETTKSYITYAYSTSYDTTQNQNLQNHAAGNSLRANDENAFKTSLQHDDKQTHHHSTINDNWPVHYQNNDQQPVYNVTDGLQNYQNDQIPQKVTTSPNYFQTFSTTKSPYDFSNFGKSTLPQSPPPSAQPESPGDYFQTSSAQPNLYEEYYRTSTLKSNLYDEYYKTSTTKQNLYDYYKTTTASQNLYEDYYRTSTTEGPNIYAEFYRTSTTRPNEYEEYYRTSSRQAPIQTTTKNPYDFSDFGKQRQTHEKRENNYYSSVTNNPHEYYKTQSTTQNPYAAYELYYKTSTTPRPYYESSGTSNYENHALAGSQSPDPPNPDPIHSQPPPPSAPLYLDSNTKPVAGTEECVDVARSISGGLTCREFLERYGFQYCNYHSMRKSCCASQREVCPTSR
ncbi:uncharacterized protein LOC117648500 isoform X2 [Thrips palmi]|uniref:Uncharacterized protein LOC117648500 isoform X2 n=1 Tax=Thrips palmi TaxID=161013 RepID=A0A6P8Z931_THRPL|nr:uncharacterized protein LOC117648500 isoform X2 [Thrips palmi]